MKLVRYFKLRAAPKQFTGEEKSASFVLGEIRARFAKDKDGTQRLFKGQLKHFLLGLDAQASSAKLQALREVMQEDLGAEFYAENIAAAEPQIPEPEVLV